MSVLITQPAHSMGPPSARQLTAIEWRLAGGPMAAHILMFTGLHL